MEPEEVAKKLGWPLSCYGGKVESAFTNRELRELSEAERRRLLDDRRFWDDVVQRQASLEYAAPSAGKAVEFADALLKARRERFGGCE